MDCSLDGETISTPYNFNVKQLIAVHNYLKTKQLTTEVNYPIPETSDTMLPRAAAEDNKEGEHS